MEYPYILGSGIQRFGYFEPVDSPDLGDGMGLHAMLEDVYLRGSYRVCQNTAERNTIYADRRKVGMLVYTVEDEKYWTLITNPTNGQDYDPGDPTLTTDDDWEEANFSFIYINSGETTATNLEGFPPGTTFTGSTAQDLWTQLLYPVTTPYILINPDSYFVVISGETVSFDLSFFGNWKSKKFIVEVDSDWATLSITGGTGNTTFDVVCEPNTGVTATFRKAYITVSVIGDSGTTYGFGYIEQFGPTGVFFLNPEPTTANLEGIPPQSTFPTGMTMQEMWDLLLYPYLASWNVTPPEATVSYNSGSTTYSIVFSETWSGSTAWFISTDQSWCTLAGANMGTGNTVFTVNYDSNLLPTARLRMAYITVILQGTSDSKTVRLVQQAPSYPIPTIVFNIASPYLVEVGTVITSRTGTWSATDTISIIPNTVQISGPQFTTITGLTYAGSTDLTFSPSLYETGATTIGPWVAQANTIFGTVITSASQSIEWDYKIYWGRFSGKTINGTQIIDNLTNQFGDLAGTYTFAAGGLEYFYWCCYNDGNNKMSKAIMADVGQQLAMVQTYNPDYSYFDVGVGYRNLGYGLVDVIINGNTYSYRVYRSANFGVNQTEIDIISL